MISVISWVIQGCTTSFFYSTRTVISIFTFVYDSAELMSRYYILFCFTWNGCLGEELRCTRALEYPDEIPNFNMGEIPVPESAQWYTSIDRRHDHQVLVTWCPTFWHKYFGLIDSGISNKILYLHRAQVTS